MDTELVDVYWNQAGGFLAVEGCEERKCGREDDE